MENNRLNIIVERNIPFIAGLLEPFADVRYLAGGDITSEAVRDADALVVRTRTRCDEALLAKSKVRFIATATIGTDHIDLKRCAGHGIKVVNAPGCNAPAVAQYVFASILQLSNRPLSQYTLGIVGVGHVGSIVERWARALDMKVLVCDPPRQRAEGGDGWSDLADIARECDIITFHTPLTRGGGDSTYHLVDEQFLASLRRAPILIDSARGPIVDTPALIAALESGQVSNAVIDCWENEPAVSSRLLELAAIATPHIAGYSLEGKVRATQMSLDALTAFFNLPHITAAADTPKSVARTVTAAAVAESYDPSVDTAALKTDPSKFEDLRNNYRYRSETSDSTTD